MSEREQFEAWFSDGGKYPHAVERSGEGYFFAAANSQWEAWQASREALKSEQVATAHRLVNKRSGQEHPWVYTAGKIAESEGDIFRVEVMPLYAISHSKDNPIDTTPNQYDALGKGGEQ